VAQLNATEEENVRRNTVPLVSLVVLAVLFSTACGGSSSSSPPSSTPETTASTDSGLVAAGEALYSSAGCNNCHSIDGSQSVGPTFEGLAGSTVQLSDGTAVTADEAYLARAIGEPDADIVDGFSQGVMSGTIPAGSVSEPDIEALVAYLESLR
jgi:mono/diheme cytochrome c family protein